MEADHAGNKRKRRRFDDDLPEFIAKKARNTQKLKSAFESIFEKYGQDFTDVGDEIDLETGEIVVDNGHVQGIQQESDSEEDEDILASPNKKLPKSRPGWSLWTPQIIKGPYRKKNRKIPLAVPNPNDIESDEEEQDEGGEHEFEEELLNQIRSHGDRQRSKSVVSGVGSHAVEDDPLFEEPADAAIEDDDPEGTTAPDPPPLRHHKSRGVDPLSEESKRLIRLRNQGLTFTEMEPYFNGRKRAVLQTMWAKLDKQYPELTGPGDVLATALADIAAGRLRTDRGQNPSWHFNRSFSKEEDRLLINLRQQGMQFVTMVPRFDRRTATTLQHRFKKLAQNRPELKQYLGRLPKKPSEHLELSLFVTDDDAEDGEQPQALLESNRKGAYQKWHSEEDALILHLYTKGVRFADMCPYLRNRSEITVRGRYKILVEGARKRSKGKTKSRDQGDTSRRRSAPGAVQSAPRIHVQGDDQDEESDYVVSKDPTQPDAVESEPPRERNRRSLPTRHAPRMLGSNFVSSLVIDPGSAVPADQSRERWDRWQRAKTSSTTAIPPHPATVQTTDSAEVKPKRGWGRPRKHPLPTPQPSASDGDDAGNGANAPGEALNGYNDLIDEPEQHSEAIFIPSAPPERAQISVRCPQLPSELREDTFTLKTARSAKGNPDLDFLGSKTASEFDPYREDDEFEPSEEDDDLPQYQTAYSESDTESLPRAHTIRTPPSRTPRPKARFTEPIDNTDHDTSLSAMPSSFEARRSQMEHDRQAQSIDVADLADDDDDADDEVEDEETYIVEDEAILADDDVDDIEGDTMNFKGSDSGDLEESPEAPGEITEPSFAHPLQPSERGSRGRKRGQKRTRYSARRRSNKPTYQRWVRMTKSDAGSGKKRGRPRKSEVDQMSLAETNTTSSPLPKASPTCYDPTPLPNSPESLKQESQDHRQTPADVGDSEHEDSEPLTEIIDLCDESDDNDPDPHMTVKQPPLSATPKAIERRSLFRKSLPLRTPLRGILKRSGFGDDDSSEDELCTPGRVVKVK